ncbi:MAG TPA: amino acid ABC transporter permease [Acidimicrobiia bacterium]|nr:amino acid ABC transporter permease [Acidimicrobiia bacterium]
MTDPIVNEVQQSESAPERQSAGAIRWAKENLFSSVLNSILSLLMLAIIVFFVRGVLSYSFSEDRLWNVIPRNMKLYWTEAYPVAEMTRTWVSLGVVVVLTGLSLAVWRVGGRTSPRQFGRTLASLGITGLVIAVLAEASAGIRIGAAVAGLVLILAGQAVRLSAGPRFKEETIHIRSILLGVLVIIGVIVWILPIESGTKVSLSIQGALLVVSYLLGELVAGRVSGGLLRGVLVGLWMLSLPVIYLVIQRAPVVTDVPLMSVFLPAVLGFIVVGGAFLWWAGSADSGDPERLASGVLVLAALGSWAVSVPMLVRFLLLGLAGFALAAPTFGGTSKAQKNIVVAWSAVVLLTAYFMAMMQADTGLEGLQGEFIGGLNLTFLLALAGLAISFPIGIMLALGRTSSMPIFRLLSTGYIETVRGVPLITVLFFANLVINRFLPREVELDDVVKAIVAVALFSAAYLAENVRGGLQSIPKGQYEAAKAMGLSTVQTTVFITLPQALRSVIPALVGQVISLFKDTSLVAIIGLADFLRVARDIVPNQPASLGSLRESLLFAMVIYWIFTFNVSRASLKLERKLGVGER